MTRALPATIVNPLIRRLNVLRGTRGAEDETLGHVRFKAQAVRKTDPAAYLAIMGMLAALEGDVDGLRSVATELNERFPYERQDHFNVIWSFMAVPLRADAEGHMDQLLSRLDIVDPEFLGECLLLLVLNGSFSAAEATLERFSRIDPSSDPGLLSVVVFIERLAKLEVAEQDYREFIDECLDSLRKQGWSHPIPVISMPFDMDEYPAVIVEFAVDDSPEAAVSASDQLLDDLIAAENSLLLAGKITTGVKVQRASNDA